MPMTEAAATPIDDSIICFEEGVIGVPRARRFELLDRPGSSIRILRCLDIEGFCLPVVDPLLADPEYHPAIGSRVAETLELQADEPALLLAVTSLEPDGPVANLRAPVIVNVRRRVAAQVILEDRRYPLRARVAQPVTT